MAEPFPVWWKLLTVTGYRHRSMLQPGSEHYAKPGAEAREWQSFTGHYIDALQGLRDRLGFWPRLVFDRGFGNESLVTHLQAEGATFYVRLKGGRFVHCG
jgi:hypothetical protein